MMVIMLLSNRWLDDHIAASSPPSAEAVATPTPDALIRSPALASEFALPTPTARPTLPPMPAADLVARWPAVQPLAAGAPVTGQLTAEDGLMQDGTYVDAYEFTAAPGEVITVELRSITLDTILLLVNSQQEVIAYNDDAGKENTDSRLVLPVPTAGTYQLLVNTYEAVTGEYTLSLASADHRNQHSPLTLGEPAAGWLIPGDDLNAAGLYVDRWVLAMPAEPIVVWARSAEFDVRLDAIDPDGRLLVKNGDLDAVGLEYDARIFLAPSPALPAGSEVTLEVALQGEFAVGGAYDLLAVPLPTTYPEKAVVKVRPVLVKGANGIGGAQALPAQVQEAISRANEIWQACGIEVVAESEMVQTIALPGLESGIEVNSLEWTEQEEALMTHDSHALPEEGIITAYVVSAIDEGNRYGIAYPTTRYPASRSGLVLIADSTVTQPAYLSTLGHEIGHILGLGHPDLDDGDMTNDTQANLMFTSEGLETELDWVYGELTPMQCMIARSSPHFLHSEEAGSLVPRAFQRHARLLFPGDRIQGALTTRDAIIAEAGEPFVDVYYFHGQTGETMILDLTATAFDPLLLIDGPTGERIALDDDGGEGWNAHLRLTLPESGDYSIGVTSVSRAMGAYQLTLTESK
jgi:hypothetical protein